MLLFEVFDGMELGVIAESAHIYVHINHAVQLHELLSWLPSHGVTTR